MSAATITYAPYVEPVTGNYNLCCVAMKWTDNPGPDINSVTTSCDGVAATFKRLSHGQFIFNPQSYSIDVPFTHSSVNVSPAVDYAKKQIKPKPEGNTTYVMVNNNAIGPDNEHSHSHGDTSNLLNTELTTFNHEVARDDPTDLGSSGVWKKGVYVYQADGTSFMSSFPSNNITASQSYYLGWLPNTQVALYADMTATVEYTLYPLDSASADGNLKAVLMPNVDEKPLFLSRPTFEKQNKILYALHLASGANNKGSERMAVFANHADFKGLNFEVVSESGEASTVRISPSTTSTSPKS